MNDAEDKKVFWARADDAWAAAWAAHRSIGSYRAVNEMLYDDEGNRLPTNRELAVALLARPDAVTDEDRENGSKARAWFQGQLFNLIGGSLTDFMARAAELAVKEEISVRTDMGMLACLPQSYIKHSIKESIHDLMMESDVQEYVGAVTEKIQRYMHILDAKKGISFDGWLVTATDGKNFYRFCSSWPTGIGDSLYLQGKVKKHEKDRDTGKPVTWLNYVKKLHI